MWGQSSKGCSLIYGQGSVKFDTQIWFFMGQVKEGFKFIEKLKIKSVWLRKDKKMAIFMVLGGIATSSWNECKDFESWEDLEETLKKTWCIKLNPSDAIAWAFQTFQREGGYTQDIIIFWRIEDILWIYEFVHSHWHVH